MARILLIKAILFAAPFLIYGAYLLLIRRHVTMRYVWQNHRRGMKIAALFGLLFMAGSVPLVGFFVSEKFVEGDYRPADYRDGKLHPAQIVPQ